LAKSGTEGRKGRIRGGEGVKERVQKARALELEGRRKRAERGEKERGRWGRRRGLIETGRVDIGKEEIDRRRRGGGSGVMGGGGRQNED